MAARLVGPSIAEHRAWLLAGAGSVAAVVLELARVAVFGSNSMQGLLWNLVLAWVPAFLALRLRTVVRRGGRSTVRLLPFGVVWLLFLPNAPYLVTDVVHLRYDDVTRYYDVPMYLVFSGTGLLLGFLSLFVVHSLVRARFGERAGWLLVLPTIGLTGIGVYLGRALRWNSWDLFVQPERRIAQLLPHASAATVGHGLLVSAFVAALLAVGYACFYAVLGARVETA